MQIYICIFTQIQLRLSRSDPAEWRGNKTELSVRFPNGTGKTDEPVPSSPNRGHRFWLYDPENCPAFSVPGHPLHWYQYQAGFLMPHFSDPSHLISQSSLLKRGRAVVGCRAQGKEAAALGCRWPCLPAQPSTGSPKVVAQRLLTSFCQRPLLYYKQQRRIIHKFIWDFILFRELFSFATKNKDFFNVLFFLYQVSQYVCFFGYFPIVRGTKDCFS